MLITPVIYSYTELTAGMQCRKGPLFIIITIAAKVTDRPLRSCKWGVIKGRTCREAQTGQATRYWPTRNSMPCPQYSVQSWGIVRVSLSLSTADFWRGLCLLFWLRSWSRFWSMPPWFQFPSTAEASQRLPGAAWQQLAGHQPQQHPTRENSVLVLSILFYFSYC